MSKDIVNKKDAFKKQKERKSRICPIRKELSSFLESLGGGEQSLLIELWRNWTTVMGAELSSITAPLGRRGPALLIGGEHAMALQELVFMKAEILERANAFMDSPFFSEVEVKLCLGVEPLNKTVCFRDPPPPRQIRLPDSSLLGGSPIQEADTPVGRCYKAYLAMFNP